MRRFRFTLTLALFAIIPTSLWPACLPHPTDATAMQQGNFTIDLPLSTTCNVRCDVCTWRVAEGSGTDITMDAASIRFFGDSQTPDAIATTTLFDLLSYAAVAQASTAGYITYPTVCGDGGVIHVYHPLCLQRLWSGTSTLFSVPATAGYCAHLYTLCPVEGASAPTINFLGAQEMGCSSGAEGGDTWQ